MRSVTCHHIKATHQPPNAGGPEAPTGSAPEALRGGGRRPAACRAVECIALLRVEYWGRRGRALAPTFLVRPQSVYTAAQRGRAAPEEGVSGWLQQSDKNGNVPPYNAGQACD